MDAKLASALEALLNAFAALLSIVACAWLLLLMFKLRGRICTDVFLRLVLALCISDLVSGVSYVLVAVNNFVAVMGRHSDIICSGVSFIYRVARPMTLMHELAVAVLCHSIAFEMPKVRKLINWLIRYSLLWIAGLTVGVASVIIDGHDEPRPGAFFVCASSGSRVPYVELAICLFVFGSSLVVYVLIICHSCSIQHHLFITRRRQICKLTIFPLNFILTYSLNLIQYSYPSLAVRTGVVFPTMAFCLEALNGLFNVGAYVWLSGLFSRLHDLFNHRLSHPQTDAFRVDFGNPEFLEDSADSYSVPDGPPLPILSTVTPIRFWSSSSARSVLDRRSSCQSAPSRANDSQRLSYEDSSAPSCASASPAAANSLQPAVYESQREADSEQLPSHR